MTNLPAAETDPGTAVTLADLDASVGLGPVVQRGDVAVRYYSDEALLAAGRIRSNNRRPD